MTIKTADGVETYSNSTGEWAVKVNGRLITQFDKPLDAYWFSTEIQARRAGEQLLAALKNLVHQVKSDGLINIVGAEDAIANAERGAK